MHVHVCIVAPKKKFGKDSFPSFVLAFATSLVSFPFVGMGPILPWTTFGLLKVVSHLSSLLWVFRTSKMNAAPQRTLCPYPVCCLTNASTEHQPDQIHKHLSISLEDLLQSGPAVVLTRVHAQVTGQLLKVTFMGFPRQKVSEIHCHATSAQSFKCL